MKDEQEEPEDSDELELVNSAEFWAYIDERRKQPTMTREELDRRLAEP
jgi:hypothetical protein